MQVSIRTTQNVLINYPVASLGDRILAYLLDSLIIIMYLVLMILLAVNAEIRIAWLWFIMIFAPVLLYHLLFEIFNNGQSPGKYALSMKVLRVDGTTPSVGDYLLRWIFAFVDLHIMSGLIAVIVIASNGKGQRLGDLAAGTTVVKLSQLATVKAQEVFVPRDDAYQASFPQVVQLNESDIELIQQALEVNRDSGNDGPVMAVTEKIKAHLGIQTDLPPIKFLYTIIRDFQHVTSR